MTMQHTYDNNGQAVNIDTLVNSLPRLDKWKADKMANLIKYYGSHQQQLSEKQWAFACRMIADADKPKGPATVNVGNMDKLIDFLKQAGQKIRWPKLLLATPTDKRPVKVSLAGVNAKVPGSITVTDGGPYGANRYYGRVMPDGTWQKPFKAFPELAEVEGLLADMSRDPVGTAKKHHGLTGRCCFCNRPIGEGDDQRSINAGYGPGCAKNYALPWG